MIVNHNSYDTMRPVWNFMRDAWAGQSHIRCVAEQRGYYQRRSNFTDGMANRYLRSGRYPNLVNVMVNQGVYRALQREPENMEVLARHVDNPEKFISWLLKQLALTGGAGLALDLNGTVPSFQSYVIEAVKNWSPTSMSMTDKVAVRDDFGFETHNVDQDVVLWNSKGNTVHTTLGLHQETGLVDRVDVDLTWNGRQIDFIPACRICTEDKPVFFGLAETSMDYFLVSALRNYILHQMVPQPVIVLPDPEKGDESQLKTFLEDKTIEYGAGSMLVLPFTSRFEIISPVVRPLNEMRQELVLIKDEMISQGVNTYMQRGGQVGNMNADTVRLHMNEQMMSFHDVLRQAEWAINKLLGQVKFLENGDRSLLSVGLEEKDQFKFRTLDFATSDIEDLVDDLVKLPDTGVEETDDRNDQIMEMVLEELRNQGKLKD